MKPIKYFALCIFSASLAVSSPLLVEEKSFEVVSPSLVIRTVNYAPIVKDLQKTINATLKFERDIGIVLKNGGVFTASEELKIQNDEQEVETAYNQTFQAVAAQPQCIDSKQVYNSLVSLEHVTYGFFQTTLQYEQEIDKEGLYSYFCQLLQQFASSFEYLCQKLQSKCKTKAYSQ